MSIICSKCGYVRPDDVKNIGKKCPVCQAEYPKDITSNKVQDIKSDLIASIQPSKSIKDKVILISLWILGLYLIMVGVIKLFDGLYYISISLILMSVFILPPSVNNIEKHINVKLPGMISAGICLAFLVIASILQPTKLEIENKAKTEEFKRISSTPEYKAKKIQEDLKKRKELRIHKKVKIIDYLQDRDGIAYEVNQTTPFSGRLVEKYKNGKKKIEATYINGEKHGSYTGWHGNGQKAFGVNFINGRQNGSFVEFYLDGKKKEVINFKGGRQHGSHTKWDKKGKKKSKTNFKYGEKHGLFTYWYITGQKKWELSYVDGNRHGLSTRWFTTGQKETEVNYVNGKQHGLYTKWHRNGKKFLEKKYVNGENVSSYYF